MARTHGVTPPITQTDKLMGGRVMLVEEFILEEL